MSRAPVPTRAPVPVPESRSTPRTRPGGGGRKPGRRSYRWLRVAVPFAVVLLLTTVTLVAHAMDQPDLGDSAYLNPDSGAGIGGRGLADLLRGEGVAVQRVTNSPDALVAAYRGDATLFIPAPSLMHPYYLRMLKLMPASTRVVLVAPSGLTLDNGRLPADVSGSRWATRPQEPDCALPEAARAGRAAIYRLRYLVVAGARQTAACYRGALVALRVGSTELLLAGASDPFRNDRLGDYHNGQLAAGLLSTRSRVVWLDLHRREAPPELVQRDPGGNGAPPLLGDGGSSDPAGSGEPIGGGSRRDAAGGTAPNPLFSAFPPWMWLVLALLVLAAALGALAAGRRLGPPVAEPLPVRVRAAETVLGRGRLYRRARARGPALEVLRGAARLRLLAAFDLRPETAPEVLAGTVAERTGRSPDEVTAILYGPQPEDDKALVRAVAQLDNLVGEALGGDAR